jgi:peptidyl-prolyl cis-trans isomerase A (cyclophilin A)
MTKAWAKGFAPLLLIAACGTPDRPPDNPQNSIEVPMQPASSAAPSAPPAPPPEPPPPAPVATGASDDIDPNAPFGMDQATAGLGGIPNGALVATIKTNKGDLTCRLFADKAPNTVANFVGLARGIRPWKSTEGAWVKRPAYDGSTFHRIIKGFMIQGGDPTGTGKGEPGYTIKDEIWTGAKHDRPGLLCMANRGHDTNGMQFFITDQGAAHLDGNYTIFGECAPVAVVHAIAAVPVKGERPVSDVVISTVEIRRAAAK